MTMRALMLSALAGLAAATAAHAQEAPLKIVAIDVEGGTATLMVTPQGHSVLFDAGWPDGLGVTRPAAGAPATAAPPSSSDRIVATARLMGLKRIDYMVTTHYHLDHIGGLLDLMNKFPIGTFVDHGPNRELASTPARTGGKYAPQFTYDAYVKSIAGKPHRTMKAGETLRLDGLLLTALASDRKLAPPVPGAGRPGVGCENARPHDENDEIENQHSLGVLATYGMARILALADQVWNVENDLVCPIDRIGPVDVLFVSNHGSNTSTSPVFINTIKPTVIVLTNGATKGASEETLKTLNAYSADRWQLHFATRSAALNGPEAQIANLTATPFANAPLHFNVLRSGAVTVTNARNGFSRPYPKAHP